MIKVDSTKFQEALEDTLREYGDAVYIATEEGIQAAAEVLAEKEAAESPKESGKLKKSWKVHKGKGLSRTVGSTRTVKSSKNGNIPLINILEYSKIRGNPFVKKTYEAAIPDMVEEVIKTIKRSNK